MTQSRREHAASVDPAKYGRDQPGIEYWRICINCEVKERAREFRDWTDEEKAAKPNYADPDQVFKEIKVENKGNTWINESSAIRAARKAVRKRQLEEGVHYSRQERRREVLDMSRALADGLLDALEADAGLLGVFGQAGIRIEGQGDVVK